MMDLTQIGIKPRQKRGIVEDGISTLSEEVRSIDDDYLVRHRTHCGTLDRDELSTSSTNRGLIVFCAGRRKEPQPTNFADIEPFHLASTDRRSVRNGPHRLQRYAI